MSFSSITKKYKSQKGHLNEGYPSKIITDEKIVFFPDRNASVTACYLQSWDKANIWFSGLLWKWIIF